MTAPNTPLWLNPAAPGQLSNPKGSNTGGDILTVKARYSNPQAQADQIGSLRAIWTRTAQGGVPSSVPTVMADTGWCGIPSGPNAGGMITPLTTGAANGINPNNSAVWKGRLYIANRLSSNTGLYPWSTLMSATINGANVGTFRYEQGPTPPVLTVADSAANSEIGAISIVNGRLYLAYRGGGSAGVGLNSVYYSTIQGDGTLGTWTQVAGPNTSSNTNFGAVSMVGYSDNATVAWLIFFFQSTVPTNFAYFAPVSLVDGSIGAWTSTTAAPAGVVPGSSGIVYDRFDGKLFIIGGCPTVDGAGAAVTTVSASTVTPGTGALGAFASNATGLTAARSQMILGVVGDTVNGNSALVYVAGGSSTGGLGAITSTTFSITTANLTAGNVAWTTGTALGLTLWRGGGFATDKHTADGTNANYLNYFGIVAAAHLSGWSGGVQMAPIVAGGGNGAYVNGGTFTQAVLGTGGVLTSNVDSTQDLTFAYQAFGQTAFGASGFLNGDWITLTVQFSDSGGDVSPIAATVIKIGQPPSISNIAATPGNDGRPVLSFNFSSGAGGDAELTYRIQLSPTVFDSGVRYDGANSVQLLSAPYLATGVQQTITVTVTSKDSPMAGSSAGATLTANFTPTLTAPGTPSGLTATPNHALGLVALAWTNNAPAGTTPGNRIYYRRNGTSAWFLLLDSASVIASFNAMDQLALNVAYDFAVSQVDNNTHSESPLSNIVLNVTISSIIGGYTLMLHIAGQGTTHFVPLTVEVSPEITSKFDVRTSLPFQQLAPTARYGVLHYAEIMLPSLIQTLANQKQLMDVLAVAYQGNPIYYRDSFSGMVVVAISPDQSEVYRPLTLRQEKIKLSQIANTFSPSTVQGSATGYLAQSFGSVQYLDPSEALL